MVITVLTHNGLPLGMGGKRTGYQVNGKVFDFRGGTYIVSQPLQKSYRGQRICAA